ncbi:MAG: signal transduction protein, partial [Cronobacter sakazakii]|nr:signal transduction protein [Cronobacter sakazakii]
TGAYINENDAFIAGLFSRLDIILGVPMAVLIEQITVPAVVREALLNRGGTLGALLNLYEGYEQNHWQGVSQGMKQLNLSEAQVTKLFLDAVEWGDRII